VWLDPETAPRIAIFFLPRSPSVSLGRNVDPLAVDLVDQNPFGRQRHRGRQLLPKRLDLRTQVALIALGRLHRLARFE
jgi:hypothetical protein